MSDIIERLRFYGGDDIRKEAADCIEAADARIEALEAALREYERDYCEGWCTDAPPQAMFDCGGCRARAALAPAHQAIDKEKE